MHDKEIPRLISKDFIKELAQYFMRFLETDFKKQRQPKRNLSSRIIKGLSVALYLDKYQSLQKELYKNFINGFERNVLTIPAGKYTTKIPDSLIRLVSYKIDQIGRDDTKELIDGICEAVDNARIENQKQYDQYLEDSSLAIKYQISSHLVSPFIKEVEKPLQATGLNTETGLFQLEVDATQKLFSALEGPLETTLREYFVENKPAKTLRPVFSDLLSVSSVSKLLKEFFESFNTADAYSEVYQLYRNREMLDKSELYLYFCELSINSFSFPLFYIPVSMAHGDKSVTLTFDNRVFVNTKAVDFVVQESNNQTGSRDSMGNKIDRIIHIEDKKSLKSQLQVVVNEVCEILKIENVDLDGVAQSKSNMIATVNNRLQLFIFDKSDEALINDYEEIIQDQGVITEAFADLINGFITENPVNYSLNVEEEWGESSISDKLIVQSPIPLNEEQKQVMLALQKENCNIVILEGPPGTGKSHTITAVVCKALLEGQSVLVLSDKEEALDVVQDKITETLNHVRDNENFQNPILRLGRNGGGLSKIIEGQVLASVKDHYFAYRNKSLEYSELTKTQEQCANSELKRVADTAENISLNDIKDNVLSEKKFSEYHWLDSHEADHAGDEFKKFHESIKYLLKNQVGYLVGLSKQRDLQNANEYLRLLTEYKNVFHILDEKPDTKLIEKFKNLSQQEGERIENWLVKVAKQFDEIGNVFNDSGISFLKLCTAETSFKQYKELKNSLKILENIASSASTYLGRSLFAMNPLLEEILSYENSASEVVKALKDYIQAVGALRSRIIGYMGKSTQLQEQVRKLKLKLAYFNVEKPEGKLIELQLLVDYLGFISEKLKQYGLSDSYWKDVVLVMLSQDKIAQTLHKPLGLYGEIEISEIIDGYTPSDILRIQKNIKLLKTGECLLKIVNISPTINSLICLKESNKLLSNVAEYLPLLTKVHADICELNKHPDHIDTIFAFIEKYPGISSKLGLKNEFIDLLDIDPQFCNFGEKEIVSYIEYLCQVNKLRESFQAISIDTFQVSMNDLEVLTTAKMAHLLDSRIIEYVNNHAADVRTLKNLLRAKQKFPKTLFASLKQAFPCILAGIRDYATYIPLEQNLFDLVIIDEASQVSIAQALPALIRGRKVLVLGDDKQFSNVKAGNASKLVNDQTRNQVLYILQECIKDVNSDNAQMYLSRAEENFDIKNSILEFCRFITNYQIMLRKHFRCYREIIDYSNVNFYNGRLQCMKARSKPISEVIKFDYISHDGKDEKYQNTNKPEIDYIESALKGLKERGYEGSIGIITPHREQATLAYTTLVNSDLSTWLDQRKFKVMTFDTCQGEEREYIFYSMVATVGDDKHMYVFPASIDLQSDQEESRLRVQRLNVGFSRAKETIHFVLSKDIDQYWGEIRNVLSFYKNKLIEGAKIKIGGTDPNSKMEEKIQQYFYETKFYLENRDEIELLPQFPLGEYLRQLDNRYKHPSYKVDFLLTYKKTKIVIEYDGFNEHFVNAEGITMENFESYMREEDIYRQKVLEGYGYKFIRLNKFNIGDDPIESINNLLNEAVKKKTQVRQLMSF